jgi:hypothetical protein
MRKTKLEIRKLCKIKDDIYKKRIQSAMPGQSRDRKGLLRPSTPQSPRPPPVGQPAPPPRPPPVQQHNNNKMFIFQVVCNEQEFLTYQSVQSSPSSLNYFPDNKIIKSLILQETYGNIRSDLIGPLDPDHESQKMMSYEKEGKKFKKLFDWLGVKFLGSNRKVLDFCQK